MLTAQALELKIKPGNYSEIERLNFTWTMVGYTSDYIWIQVTWQYPDRISKHIEDADFLEIYFWGNTHGYFYSEAYSKEVRYGTRLEVPLIR